VSVAAGRTELTVGGGAQREERLCVRPGTVVSLVLRARAGERWTAVGSSAPVLALPFGWRVDADGTAHAAIRCAGVRAGSADIAVTATATAPGPAPGPALEPATETETETAPARAPDLAGPAPVAFTHRLSVVPRPKER
jgi:hypothetical protein